MSNDIQLDEPNVSALIGSWTGLELWHAASQAGAYSLLVQIPYVSGQIVYSYTDAAGLSTDWYKVRRYAPGPQYGLFSTAWGVTLGTPTRRSLGNTRRLLAEKLGGYGLVTTDSAAPDSTSIVASELAGGLDPDAYRQAWVYPTQTGVDPTTSAYKLRRVGNQALNTSTGQLTVTVAWPLAISSGVDTELHTLLPPVRHDKLPGLVDCLNHALAELWTYSRLSLTGVNGQPSYDLSTANDWLDAGAISNLYGAALDPTLNPQTWPAFEGIQDADSLRIGVSPTLQTGAAATVGVFRPADTWIKAGGVWGSSTTGLAVDTDEQLFNPDILVMVALVHAYHALSTQGEAGERGYYLNQENLQRTKVNRWKMWAMPRPARRVNHGLPVYSGSDAKDFGSWGVSPW